ncbi:acyl-CoA synthetase (AMP-forming)/AMP-acid ligase II [Nocardioides albertanoniae]|uniref:Acyl-CoA synthetase (AMP-forming)/AMP-acid ligase II n=1 Tax=Nocardioides albertanoniae TaxID=1175486 RepID=A0A543A1Q8_9ACTN|nr:AMP-binding protein [Nocardioides albertanoniae]TQL66470.1 acyl-CoA synthetase (AMP-forming)/AMP-acid ligase II [Nocardioides albertanoniae]
MTPRTIPALLEKAKQSYADRPAIVDGATTLTYTDLAEAAENAARAFLAAGVRSGDRVAIWAPNRWEFPVAVLGAQTIGAAVVPLNTRYRGHEAREILERSRATALITLNGFLGADYVQMLRDAGPLPEHLIAIVDLSGDDAASSAPVVGWSAFLAKGEEVTDERLDGAKASVTPDTVADLLFTSGTTGKPKGVMSAQRQTIGVADVWARGAELTPEDRYAIVNPFFHGFGYKAGFIAAFTSGAAVHPIATYDPTQALKLIQDEQITVLPGAPTIFATLINHPDLKTYDISSLRFAIAGAASVPESLFSDMLDILGIDEVKGAYGLTECMVATATRPGEDPAHVAQVVGPAVEGLEIRTVTESGEDAAQGEDGEVWIRGDNVMLGYFENPEATQEAIDADGWLHTGDVGRLDEHGCLKITDRIKDMFTVGGFNVYPAEVENALADHPDIVESAVIGVPDARLGSVGRAFVVVRNDLVPDEIDTWLKDRLANYKRPKTYAVVDALPRNASGKILKTELRS